MLIKSPCITTHASFLKSNDITGLLMIKQTIAHQYLERTPPKCLSSIEIEIVKKDCLELAQSIKAARGSVCVLNFANQFIVGGDYLNLSALAQEESIIRRTNLLDSLIQLDGVIPGNVANPYKYALPDCLGFDNAYQRSGFGEFTALYSPEITVGVLDLNTRKNISPFQIDVISSAAYNLSFAEESPDPALYMAGTVFKIINQFRTAKLHGQRNLVLGAFGCGAFQNSPTTIAEMYCAVLNEYEFQGCFDTIYFAITDHLNSENYAAFSNIFSSVKIKTVHDLLKDTFSLESMPHFLEEQLSAFSKIDTQDEFIYWASKLMDMELKLMPRRETEKKTYITDLLETINSNRESAQAILSASLSSGEMSNYYISSAFFKGKSYFTLKLENLLSRMSTTVPQGLLEEGDLMDWSTETDNAFGDI